ncbi:bifunctional transcriptional activator/DNA repair enzyme AdaA [Paenibacillus pini]|uniref:ADA regulatory protein n=1 Tax=Paenibacillus pini JCM 16418 TaxID=1236976 RepID=W7YDT4_9BACL|nr:bifunctional transcriptional activator/DNA repair enzyme AdaA [Paenibacillus pini]GAF06627.1 ADA regulatory protein [Paenibacillus pini JCM 16418]
MSRTITEIQWQAVIRNDAAYDGQFFYAVQTTGIFCRPSCKSRPPKIENILIFQHAEQALSASYRPCKRCKPTGQRLPDDEWITMVTDYIHINYMKKLTLPLLADISHGSPFHLHRTFKRIQGVTLLEYIQHIRMDRAKELLLTTKESIAEIGKHVGLTNTSYFITLFKKRTGQTPSSYRQIEH